jgi:hypothetical protein
LVSLYRRWTPPPSSCAGLLTRLAAKLSGKGGVLIKGSQSLDVLVSLCDLTGTEETDRRSHQGFPREVRPNDLEKGDQCGQHCEESDAMSRNDNVNTASLPDA